MSILIKGIEMPKENDELRLFIHSNGQAIILHRTYFDETEAIPIPPHGRLKDTDKMKESIRKQTACLRLIGEEFAVIGDTLEKGFLQEIDNAPTVIPAEPSKEE